MKVMNWVTYGFLILCLTHAGCGGSGGGSGDAELKMGLLQFRVEHNLQDDSCLPNQCDMSMEEEANVADWLAGLATLSNMAVLHWDRPIPWLAFDENPPQGVSRIDFYDGRIDDRMLSWVNAFVVHFENMSSGYLAVSILNGSRDGLESFRVYGNQYEEIAGVCPDLSPGTQIEFEYDPGGGPVTVSFDLERSYTNFVMYLYEKLQPDYLALMVETNLYKVTGKCPAQWDGLAQLYRAIYDTVRPQVDSRTKVFATLTFQNLLGYDLEACHGPLAFESCAVDPPSPPDYDVPDPATCYPLELSAISDLDQGDRLEVLALSFYPDALLMDVAGDNLIELYPGDWNGGGDCDLHAPAVPYLDPVAALDRFGWDKPVAFAEAGGRSDRTIQVRDSYFVRLPADLTSQAFWLDLLLNAAKEKQFEFYVQVFADDYEAMGPWIVHENVLDAPTFSVLNNFAYMGLYDSEGFSKAGVTQLWLDALP